ncbi:MAG: heavy-metal-associated domain-containing protein [Candidatus Brocadia sp.]|nr:MAG: heavy-metal-associated domain-containing protein [Candidatus Brocadia sp.]
MDCQDGAVLVERMLNVLAGIKNVEIYLFTQGVKVICDPSLISVQQIIKSIAETGMKASVVKDVRAKNRMELASKGAFVRKDGQEMVLLSTWCLWPHSWRHRAGYFNHATRYLDYQMIFSWVACNGYLSGCYRFWFRKCDASCRHDP